MALNSRSKGQRGERQVAAILNDVIEKVLAANEWSQDVIIAATSCIQRNQNQSAVGGCDLNGVFGLAVEIKRVEQLHIEAWWMQCVAQAKRNAEVPVLLYRQNHQPWRCITLGCVALPGGRMSHMRVQFEEEAFKIWFYQWVYYKLATGEVPRI